MGRCSAGVLLAAAAAAAAAAAGVVSIQQRREQHVLWALSKARPQEYCINKQCAQKSDPVMSSHMDAQTRGHAPARAASRR